MKADTCPQRWFPVHATLFCLALLATPAGLSGATATGSITSGDSPSHFDAACKADYYLLAGLGKVTITLASAQFDAVLALYDQNRQLLESNDNGVGGGSTDALITRELSSSQTCYIEVTARNNGRGAYLLTTSVGVPIVTVNPWNGDTYELDNAPGEAKAIASGQTQNRSIHMVGDVDWIQFTIGINGASNIRIETDGTTGDTQAWLFGPNSSTALLRYDDDSGNGAFSSITQPTLSPGTYYIKIQDYGNNGTIAAYVLKTSWEGDPKPNLTPSARSGWLDRIIVSRQTGTTRDSIGLLNTDALYVDWAVKNAGESATGARFFTELYVDGQLRNTWHSDPPLGVGQEVWQLDFSIGQLSAGSHTLRIKTDSSGVIAENNEADNEYVKTITVGGGDIYETDNAPADAKIIANGQVQNRTIHMAGDLDWAKFTIGANGASNVRIETDGPDGDTQMWLFGPNSATAQLKYDDDSGNSAFSLITQTTLPAGAYYIKIQDYGNNSTIAAYTLKASWDDTPWPNLTPYNRSGWSDRIVVSKLAGSTTDSSGLANTDTLYVDWVVRNTGTAPTGTRFYTELYVDGQLKNRWYSDPPLGVNQEVWQLDYNIGSLSTGSHTLRIKTDSTGTIPESNEADNEYTKTITIGGAAYPDSFESDNKPAEAKTINNGQAQNHSIHVAGDVDWIKFTIGAFGAGNLQIETDGAAGDTQMWLYGPNSTTAQLNYDDDSGNGAFSLITRPAILAGTYYIKIQDYGNNSTIPAYTLKVSWTDPFTDLVPFESGINRSLGNVGDSFGIVCRIKNQGGNASMATRVFFYASRDAWSTVDAVKIGEVALEALPAGGVSAHLLMTWIPSVAGTYYVGYWIDAPQWVLESNEINNQWYWTRVQVSNPGQPDLAAMSDTISRLSGNVGNAFAITLSVKNQGSWRSEATQVHFFANQDAWSTAAAAKIGEANLEPLAPGELSAPLVFTWYPTVPGNYFVGYWIDGPLWVLESNESNNQRFWANVQVGLDSFEVDDSPDKAKDILNGETQTRSIYPLRDIDWIKIIIGADGASNVRIETDGAGGDPEMWLFGPNSWTTEVAHDDDSGNGSFPLITRPDLPAGTYYIKVQDLGNNETIAAYSLRASWIDGQPDLAKHDHSIYPLSGKVGDTFVIQCRVKNQGKIPSKPTQVFFYANLGSWSTETAAKVGEASLAALASGEVSPVLQCVWRPALSGNYSVGYWIDAPQSVAENNENNNQYQFDNVQVGVDIFENDNAPDTAKIIANGEVQQRSIHEAGNVDWVKFTIGPNGASTIRIATDGSDGDTQMWLFGPNNATTQLAFDDDSGNGAFALITQTALAAGTYFVKIQDFGNDGTIDAYTLKATWIDLQIDLVPEDSQISRLSGSVGDSFVITCRVRNQGIGSVGTTKIFFYANLGAWSTAAAAKVGETDLPVPAAGSVSAPLLFTWRPTVAGNYSVGFWIDGPQSVVESNENNNQWHWDNVSVAAVVATDPFEPDNQPTDAKIIGNGETQNRSIKGVGDVDWIKFTVSADGASNVRIETDGTQGDTEVSLYGPNNWITQINYDDDSGNGAFSLITRTDLGGGTYYLKVQEKGNDGTIDPYALRISWNNGRPDLARNNDTISRLTGTVGDGFEISCRVVNQGLWASGATKVYFYANLGSWSTAEAAKIGEVDLPALAVAGVSAPLLFIWHPTVEGTYSVGYWIDAPQSVVENNENNNQWHWDTIEVSPTVNPPVDVPDAYEPDNAPEQAKLITNGETQQRSIHQIGTWDWIKFIVGSSGASNLRIEADGAEGDTQMWLYGPNNWTTQLEYDDDSGNGSFSMITRASLAPGTYYIKIQDYGHDGKIAAYTLRLSYQ